MLNLIKYKNQVKQGLFQLELQGIIKNECIYKLDTALQIVRKVQPIKINNNQYNMEGAKNENFTA